MSVVTSLLDEGERDNEFWYDTRIKVFKVEERHFKVSIGLLINQSEFFNDLFTDASASVDVENQQEEGSEQFPIFIADETASAFTLLLKWVYKRETTGWTLDDWLESLRMASKFRVPSLITAAMKFVTAKKSKVPPVKVIGLCVTYHLDWTWCRKAIAQLCNVHKIELRKPGSGPDIPLQLYWEILEVREIILKRRLVGTSYPFYCHVCQDTKGANGCRNCSDENVTILQHMDMDLVDKILENMKQY
ncbi:hypothetical protein DL96DRAFT_1625285 [Flagelloscypha sp. PMI_526]|nr:hypothetical protein DL96DRAFT_1625285 [Flagelloscypha sp. PMI_526]